MSSFGVSTVYAYFIDMLQTQFIFLSHSELRGYLVFVAILIKIHLKTITVGKQDLMN